MARTKALVVENKNDIITKKEEKISIFHELNIIRNFYFCMNPREAKKTLTRELKDERIVDGEKESILWRVAATEAYGYPSVLDFEVFNVFIKFISKFVIKGEKIPEVLYFSINDIVKELGHSRGGKTYEEIKNSILRMTFTGIQCNKTRIKVEGGKRKFYDVGFSIFSSCGFKGEIDKDGNIIDKNFVSFDKVLKENLDQNYFLKIDFNKYDELETAISKLLFLKLEYSFYIVKEKEPNKQSLTFSKKYDDICNYWLLIKPQKKLSYVKQQLEKHLLQLKNTGYILDYDICKSKYDKDFVLHFSKQVIPDSPKKISKEKELALLFFQEKYNNKRNDYDLTNEIESSKELIKIYGFSKAKELLNKALILSKKDKRDISHIKGLISYDYINKALAYKHYEDNKVLDEKNTKQVENYEKDMLNKYNSMRDKMINDYQKKNPLLYNAIIKKVDERITKKYPMSTKNKGPVYEGFFNNFLNEELGISEFQEWKAGR